MKRRVRILRILFLLVTIIAISFSFPRNNNAKNVSYVETQEAGIFSKTTNYVSSLSDKVAFKFFGRDESLQDDAQKTGIVSAKKEGLSLAPNEIRLSGYEELINEVVKLVKTGYIEEVKDEDIARAAMKGIMESLDPHSSYMTPEDFKQMQIETSGEFGGVGIEITMEKSLVKVVSPIEDTPADKAGIRAGDYISEIDNESVIGKSIMDAVSMMRGKVGTKVQLTILREGEDKPLKFSIKRGKIKVRAIKSRRIGNVAYIRLTTFSAQTYPGLRDAMIRLQNEIGANKLEGVVLDLRNNPGGLLNQSVKVSEAFLPRGVDVVSIKGRSGDKNKIEYKSQTNEVFAKDIPMVVLVNEGSASASEIVAGALQDHNRAIVMGKKSFGKGSVQNIIELGDGGKYGAVRMTIARYYTPSGKSIQAKGIEPDIEVGLAKIEQIDVSGMIKSEADLSGHLENNQSKKSSKKSKIKDENADLYNKDYQLARAVDLLRGMSVFKKNVSK